MERREEASSLGSPKYLQKPSFAIQTPTKMDFGSFPDFSLLADMSNQSDSNINMSAFLNNDSLSIFLEDLKDHINGESEISDLCFYVTLLAYILVILVGSSGNVLVLMAVFIR
jgi:hypothetical protein